MFPLRRGYKKYNLYSNSQLAVKGLLDDIQLLQANELKLKLISMFILFPFSFFITLKFAYATQIAMIQSWLKIEIEKYPLKCCCQEVCLRDPPEANKQHVDNNGIKFHHNIGQFRQQLSAARNRLNFLKSLLFIILKIFLSLHELVDKGQTS